MNRMIVDAGQMYPRNKLDGTMKDKRSLYQLEWGVALQLITLQCIPMLGLTNQLQN
jgi:hypothetical protein